MSWEGLGLLVQPILEHSLGFSMILGQDMGRGDEEEASGGKFKQGVEIINLLATQAEDSRRLRRKF